MAKKSVAKNYMYNLVYQVLIVILPIITAPYLSRVLGATKIGIYTYTYNIVSYFMLFGSLGVALYGKREIAYVQDDKKKRTQLFWEILVVKFITVTIATAVYVLVFIVLGKEYNIFYTILLFELLSTAVDITWFFQGLEDFKKTLIPEANKRVGYRLVMDAIVDAEKLEVTDKELEDGLNEAAEKYGMKREDFEKEIGNKELFKYDLLMKKAMKVVTE